MSSASATTAKKATASILQLAKCILCPTTTKSDLPPLFLELARTLTRSSEQHLLTSRVPRVPPKNNFPAPTMSIEEVLKSIESLPTRPFNTTTNPGQQLSSANSTYGETPPETIRDLIATLLDRHNYGKSHFPGDFIDVGSGNGSVILSAALTGRFQKYRGIEYDLPRHETALLLKLAYDNASVAKQDASPQNYAKKNEKSSDIDIDQGDLSGASTIKKSITTAVPGSSSNVDFFCGDVRNVAPTLDGASVVFANCVVWDAELCGAMGTILDKARLQPPALVVSMSRRFPSPSFDLVDILNMPANSGGDFTFYVCQKKEAALMGGEGSLAVSDASPGVILLREQENEDLVETLVSISLDVEEGTSGMTFLAALGTSESTTRVLLRNRDFLPKLAMKLGWDVPLAQRASASMVLRAISDFPIGRREIAKSDDVILALLSSLERWQEEEESENETNLKGRNDHPIVRANVLDIVGQVLYDPVGNKVLGDHGVDAILENVLIDAAAEEEEESATGWENEVLEAGREAQAMRMWWQR